MGILPLVGISIKIKEEIRKQHPEYGKKRIEVAHIIDHFLGGTGHRENLQPLTVAEHILDHVVKAENAIEPRVVDIHYLSAHTIAKRATFEEIVETNQLLRTRKK